MSIRTTVTFDDDVVERVKQESRSRGATFRETVNDLLRDALLNRDKPRRRSLKIVATHMGRKQLGLNYDSIEALLEFGEGEWHR